jgi:cystathionine gamma-synthase
VAGQAHLQGAEADFGPLPFDRASARAFTVGESLGGVESPIEHPARMTDAFAAGSPLEVPADLIRLSVGIEDCDDLIDDLRQALVQA